MNKENLKRMAEHIRTIPQERFSMGFYRSDSSERNAECNSVGCVIGHCTILDRENFNLHYENNFTRWSEEFTGLPAFSESWGWCFNSIWADTDNTPEGAYRRIMYLIEIGLPENWFEQMIGEAEITY